MLGRFNHVLSTKSFYMALFIHMAFHSVIPAQDSNLEGREAGLFVPLWKLRLQAGGGLTLLYEAEKGESRNVLMGKEVVRSPTALLRVCHHCCQGHAPPQ